MSLYNIKFIYVPVQPFMFVCVTVEVQYMV